MPNRTFSGSISSGYTTAHSVHKLMHAMLLLLAFTLCQGQSDGPIMEPGEFLGEKEYIEAFLNEKYRYWIGGDELTEAVSLKWDSDTSAFKIQIDGVEQADGWTDNFMSYADDGVGQRLLNDGNFDLADWEALSPLQSKKFLIQKKLNTLFESELDGEDKLIVLDWNAPEYRFDIQIDGTDAAVESGWTDAWSSDGKDAIADGHVGADDWDILVGLNLVDGDEDVDTTFKDAKDTIEEYLNEKYEDDLSGEKIDLVWDEDEDKYKIKIGDDEQDKDWAEGFDDASAINDGDLTSGEWDKMKPFGEKSEMEEELNERFEDELETGEQIELKWDVNENAYAVEINNATPDGDWVEDLAGKDGLMTETEWNAFNNTDYLTIEYWTDNHWMISDHEVSYYWGPVLLLGVIVIIAVMFCRRGNENSHQMGHGHYQPQSGYNSSYRRRRLPAHPTLTKLCPGDQSLVSNLPRPARMLLRDSPHISCCANKIDDDLMYKIVGLSCIAQFFWLFVGYQVYKYCKHARKPRTEQEHHELREITVVRH